MSGTCVITAAGAAEQSGTGFPEVPGGKTRMVVNTTFPAVFVHPVRRASRFGREGADHG